MATTYRPCTTPVPLGRAVRFTALLKEICVTSRPEASPEPEPESALVPIDIADQAAPVRAGMEAGAALGETLMQLHIAIVEQGRYADVAALIVVADEDGATRDVTPAEADSDALPASVYAEAFRSFTEASSQLTMAHFDTPTDRA